jgi:hypothetical protein
LQRQQLPAFANPIGSSKRAPQDTNDSPSSRPDSRQFNLADYVQVKSASFDNGLLTIELVREIPEAIKPRRIAITGAPAGSVQRLEGRAA